MTLICKNVIKHPLNTNFRKLSKSMKSERGHPKLAFENYVQQKELSGGVISFECKANVKVLG